MSLIDAWIKCSVEHKTLEIEYQSQKGEITHREVEPDYYGWDINGRTFGLWGFCRLRKQIRSFKEENVLNWKYAGDTFNPIPNGRWKELVPSYQKKRLNNEQIS